MKIHKYLIYCTCTDTTIIVTYSTHNQWLVVLIYTHTDYRIQSLEFQLILHILREFDQRIIVRILGIGFEGVEQIIKSTSNGRKLHATCVNIPLEVE